VQVPRRRVTHVAEPRKGKAKSNPSLNQSASLRTAHHHHARARRGRSVGPTRSRNDTARHGRQPTAAQRLRFCIRKNPSPCPKSSSPAWPLLPSRPQPATHPLRSGDRPTGLHAHRRQHGKRRLLLPDFLLPPLLCAPAVVFLVGVGRERPGGPTPDSGSGGVPAGPRSPPCSRRPGRQAGAGISPSSSPPPPTHPTPLFFLRRSAVGCGEWRAVRCGAGCHPPLPPDLARHGPARRLARCEGCEIRGLAGLLGTGIAGAAAAGSTMPPSRLRCLLLAFVAVIRLSSPAMSGFSTSSTGYEEVDGLTGLLSGSPPPPLLVSCFGERCGRIVHR
jgi:hypothetical protein